MPDFNVDWADWTSDHDGLVAIRTKVFVDEQKVPVELEMDEMDAQCVHIKATDSRGKIIATARLLPNHYIGRMCVAREYRRQGIATAMMHKLIEYAHQQKFEALHLNAQVTALHFYQNLGFEADSEVFVEAGIDHRHMTLKLGANSY